ncbi:hypothetical protein F5B21DRAFT_483634 [Xylaria acuta]|nr:hypothetical protein F5B21DRAFT_483634 [Xylaria acuta]
MFSGFPSMATDTSSNDLRPKQTIRLLRELFKHAYTLLDGIDTAKTCQQEANKEPVVNQGCIKPDLPNSPIEPPTSFQLASLSSLSGKARKAHKRSILGDVFYAGKGYNKSSLKLKAKEIAKEVPSRQGYEPVTSKCQLILQARPHEDALRHAIHATTEFDPPIPRIVLFSDASKTNSAIGAGVTYKLLLGGNNEWVDDSYGLLDKVSTNGAEITGIYCALRVSYDEALRYIRTAEEQGFRVVAPSIMVFTDSIASLDRIYHHRFGGRPKNEIIPSQLEHEMFRPLELLEQLGCRVEINWVPGHSGVEGNYRAHRLASLATQYVKLIAESGIEASPGLIYPLSGLVNHGAPLSFEPMQEGSSSNSGLERVLRNDDQRTLLRDLFGNIYNNRETLIRTIINRLLEGHTGEEVIASISLTEVSKRKKRKRSEQGDRDRCTSISVKKIRQAQNI